MSRLYLVPDRKDMKRMCALAAEYGCSFEYNEFYMPKVMDDPKSQEEIIADYQKYKGEYIGKESVAKGFHGDTMHGAFLDVTIHSDDPMIRDASMLRVRQSMEIAKRMGLKGVVFHTGRLAGFRAEGYLRNWRDRNEAFQGDCRTISRAADLYGEHVRRGAGYSGGACGENAGREKFRRMSGLCSRHALTLSGAGMD